MREKNGFFSSLDGEVLSWIFIYNKTSHGESRSPHALDGGTFQRMWWPRSCSWQFNKVTINKAGMDGQQVGTLRATYCYFSFLHSQVNVPFWEGREDICFPAKTAIFLSAVNAWKKKLKPTIERKMSPVFVMHHFRCFSTVFEYFSLILFNNIIFFCANSYRVSQ